MDIYLTALIAGTALLATAAWYKKALTSDGAIVSFITGSIIAVAFSLYGLLLLGVFFVSSTVLERVLNKDHSGLLAIEEKGDKRDAAQVLANGGWAAAASLFYIITAQPVWLAGFIGALAAANSDTWASVTGKKSRETPVMILTGQPLPKGQSGGITRSGNIGAMLGSLLIVLSALIFSPLTSIIEYVPWLFWAALAGTGMAGQVADALAGAFMQGLYKCRQCATVTENPSHCLKAARLLKGYKWVNNDIVNHICTISGMAAGLLIGFLFIL